MTKQDEAIKKVNLHIKIAERAKQLGVLSGTIMTLLMDLDAAEHHFNLDFEKLFEADDANFTHDILGIQTSINRVETQLHANPPVTVFDGTFVPRFARN